ncbi:Fatty acid hydroxylase superfamily protein [Pigmentiphaga humi]|uniref:Fatty acid hydroxylase superfamily protein n=1 Tax=Pigmentiphaga humi TaxID=2478468 RepID=A0A3P4B747_9BURK|nr:sterol desaturase family protein [Pigmentiphaga humi]VCU71336.1 Fatty acid hydroxylase superfamily protein [Pigmentiphaga humi]
MAFPPFDFLGQQWAGAVDWLTVHLVVPAIQGLDLAARLGDPREIAEAVLIAAIQLFLIGGVMRPLESLLPAERWEDRRHTTVDRSYTLLMLLGLFPLFSFLVLMPFAHMLGGGAATDEPSGLKAWIPWFGDHPYILFAVYYVIYDCVYYWMHRAQHVLPWWWAMHSMHHSQRQMSCWSNDRSHYLDGMLQSFILASVGLAMGVEPSEFALLGLLSELVQNFSHANVALRLGKLGKIGERLMVGPRFHRNHHMLRDPERPLRHNCNFGQVLPWWDQLFGTALYHDEPLRPTGVSDPEVDADNERGLVAMQWYTLRRFWGAVTRLNGWKPGDVSFSMPGYVPVHDEAAPPVLADARTPGGAQST